MLGRKNLTLILGMVVGTLVCALIVVLGFFGRIENNTFLAASQAETFMRALRDGDYEQAYMLCEPALQQELGSVEQIQATLKENGLRPKSWRFISRTVEYGRVIILGTVVSSRAGQLEINLKQTQEGWKISAFSIR